ncbi:MULTISPECIES: rod shape-determining protein MreD [Ignavibacterium]|jgi:rod shape-determining protein MreD|uniref:rod shape-determining protein MreD n=1 Tax=Ignavibacterium TaxID=795750 RepID=UPI0025BCF724|nr:MULTISPECIES: rod shape-determining protein MreD [Ignavibacterium]MBI5663053.1 rod shape-determining protein MreD [Ignavibacterium album]
MKINYIISILIFIPVLIIQTTVIPLVSIDQVVPDLILILLVYYSVTEGQIYGTVLGFIYGFFFDIVTGSLLGSTIIAKTVAGFVAGYFSSENKIDIYLMFFNFGLIVFLCALIDQIIYSFFSAFDISSNIFLIFFQNAFLPAFYTALLSMIVIIFVPKKRIL